MSTSSAFQGQDLLLKPNVVIILADDLGWGDPGCYGGRTPTTNIDALAENGIRFTNYYAAPVCTPSRVQLLLGRYPDRIANKWLRDVIDPFTPGLPIGEATLAEILKPIGYKTAIYGKWHLGDLNEEDLPTNHGFDEFTGITVSHDMQRTTGEFKLPLYVGTKQVRDVWGSHELIPTFTNPAMDFIDRAGNNPFFLYFTPTTPHTPLDVPDRFVGASGAQGDYGDSIIVLDWAVGEIINALRKNDLYKNTLVIFTSDNGAVGPGSGGGRRGQKRSFYQGGFSVPFIASLPGKIPANTTSPSAITCMDIIPTIANLCGAELPKVILDGINIWPLMTGEAKSLNPRIIFHLLRGNVGAAEEEGWKIVWMDGDNILAKPELYYLPTDPGEQNNVAELRPDIIEAFERKKTELIQSFPPPE